MNRNGKQLAGLAQVALVLAVSILGGGNPVLAQENTGNLYVTVMGIDGNALPGATLELFGLGATQERTANSKGEARFVKLDPGIWTLEASLAGFSTVEFTNVEVRIARNTSVEVQMTPALEETITVTAEIPLLDRKQFLAGTTISQIELEKIPTARDPWALMTQIPGVETDRISVGGSENYTQSAARTPAVANTENTFLVDGVDVSDLVYPGYSATWYDFDQFAEMQFSTGGTDVTKDTGGVSINFVTKRGTNEFRGSARFNVTDRDGLLFFDRSDPDISPSDLAPGQESFTGNSIDKIDEWGFEAGGPVLRDRLWFWGSYAKNDSSFLRPGPGESVLTPQAIFTNTTFKVNAQLADRNSALGSWNSSEREEFGKNASPTRPLPTTWDQRGPDEFIKIEDTHIFSSSFFLTGSYSKADLGFELVSKATRAAGKNAPQSHLDDDGVWQGSFWSGAADTPSDEYRIDGSYFFNTGNTSHELKFGSRLREFERDSRFAWSNDNAWSIGIGLGLEPAVLITQRGDIPPVTLSYTSFWVQDTLTLGNFTINAGLRYDLQEGENLPVEAAANPWFPEEQPSLSFGGADAPFDWETISPRIGVTYALGEERKTLIRASLSQFPQRLSLGDVERTNPAGLSYSTFLWFDTDGSGDFNGSLDGSRPGPDTAILIGWSGWEPANPTALVSPNVTDPDLDPELISELILGVEHALMPEFVVGANLTFRRVDDIQETIAFVRDAGAGERLANRSDYVPAGTTTGTVPTTGTPYSVDAWTLDPDLEYSGGTFLTNGGRERDYAGLGINATKRLTNRWMARGYIQWGQAEWNIPESFFAGQSPNLCEDDGSFGCNGAHGGNIDGGLFAVQSSLNTGVWSQSTWQFNVNGMYQIAPNRSWGFNVAGNIFGREGYPLPYFVNVTTVDGQNRDLLAFDKLDRFRVDDILLVDLRLDKEFAATGNTSFTVGIDLFNAFNSNPVMQRERGLTLGQADWLRETLAPRIWRLGARLNWR